MFSGGMEMEHLKLKQSSISSLSALLYLEQ